MLRRFCLFDNKGLIMKISVTSKLDGVRSWSLEALETCPGSIAAPGVLVDACAGCYATDGTYRFANVKNSRAHNKKDWQRLAWSDDMVEELEKDDYFRWFDSGDMYTLALAEKILDVMKRTPWVKHWLPTRMYKFPKFRQVLTDMQALKNVSVRFSSDSVTGEYTKGLHGSVIVPTPDDAKRGVKLCGAYDNNGQCGPCRACYDKRVKVIAYPAHGRKMNKVIMLKRAA